MLENFLEAVNAFNQNRLLLLGAGVFLSVFIIKKYDLLPSKLLVVASVVIGLVLGFLTAQMTGENISIGIYNGFLAGLIASGGYDLFRMLAAAMTGKLKTWDDIEDLLDDGKLNDSNKTEQ